VAAADAVVIGVVKSRDAHPSSQPQSAARRERFSAWYAGTVMLRELLLLSGRGGGL